MKNYLRLVKLIFITTAVVVNCGNDSTTEPSNERDYRQDMRDFVEGISEHGKAIKPDFIVIPQNGQELITTNGEESGTPAWNYLSAIDGMGREDLFYGYDIDNVPTPVTERDYMISFLDVAERNGVEVLVTDYCWTHSYVDDSYAQNNAKDYISFAADNRELNNIPVYPATVYNANTSDVTSLPEAKNFLYLINSGSYNDKGDFIDAIQDTDYDIVIMDLFFDGSDQFTPSDISLLKVKAGGGSRLVVSYMSIGEAEDYRYYWLPEWTSSPPPWLAEENPDWAGNYKVRYWFEDWQNIIYGDNESYLNKILDTGFDGVYLDIIDAFEYFEDQ